MATLHDIQELNKQISRFGGLSKDLVVKAHIERLRALAWQHTLSALVRRYLKGNKPPFSPKGLDIAFKCELRYVYDHRADNNTVDMITGEIVGGGSKLPKITKDTDFTIDEVVDYLNNKEEYWAIYSKEDYALIKKEPVSEMESGLKNIVMVVKYDEMLAKLGMPDSGAKNCLDYFKSKMIENGIPHVIQNPYILSRVKGMAFPKLDTAFLSNGLIKKLGDSRRVEAGLRYLLDTKVAQGNTAINVNEFLSEAEDLLGLAASNIETFLEKLVNSPEYQDIVIKKEEGESIQKKRNFKILEYNEKKMVTIPRIAAMEDNIANSIRLLQNQFSLPVPWAEPEWIKMDDPQKATMDIVVSNAFSIMIGGPGRGKATMLRIAVAAAEAAGYDVILCAPTGNAAQRMTESTGKQATTIHRMLSIPMVTPINKKTWIFIDEASMLDVELAEKVIGLASANSLNKSMRCTLVGDKRLLPPTSFGNVLHDCIASGSVPVGELVAMHGSAHGSGVHMLTDDIIKGNINPLTDYKGVDFTDVDFFRDCAEPAVDLAKFIKTQEDTHGHSFQAICSAHGGDLGVEAINKAIRDVINPKTPFTKVIYTGEGEFRLGDKIIQTVNNPELEVYNGEIGVIEDIITSDNGMLVQVNLEGRSITYKKEHVKDLELGYCLTVHKAQGLQFKGVFMIIPRASKFTNVNLVYTGITRTSVKLHIVSTEKEWKKACTTVADERCTLLAHMLKGGQM
jgi:exodeoxyribonuclease V alpha subunit